MHVPRLGFTCSKTTLYMPLQASDLWPFIFHMWLNKFYISKWPPISIKWSFEKSLTKKRENFPHFCSSFEMTSKSDINSITIMWEKLSLTGLLKLYLLHWKEDSWWQLGSCVLKGICGWISINNLDWPLRDILIDISIDTQLTLDWYSINVLSNTWLTLDQHSIETWSTLGQ